MADEGEPDLVLGQLHALDRQAEAGHLRSAAGLAGLGAGGREVETGDGGNESQCCEGARQIHRPAPAFP